MTAFQNWMVDTGVELVVLPGETVECEVHGVCTSGYRDLPPLVAPVTPVSGGQLRVGPADPPWDVAGGLARTGVEGVAEVAPGTAPVTGGLVQGGPDGLDVVVELVLDVRELVAMPPPAGQPALATITVNPPPATLATADGPVVLELGPAPAGEGPRVVTGGRATIAGGRLELAPRTEPAGYTVGRSEVWEPVLADLDGGPLGREIARLAAGASMPEVVLRRFAVQGALWSGEEGFDLDRHLDSRLAALPLARRAAARDASAAAITLVLERLLRKPAR